MKTKILVLALCALVSISALGAASFAAAVEDDANGSGAAPKSSWGLPGPMFGKGEAPNLTDEQKAEIEDNMKARQAEMDSRMAAQQAQWDALSDEQKEALYSLQDIVADAQIAVIDKMLEYGLIDEETAQEMKDRLEASKASMRENGGMHLFGAGFGHRGGGRGMRGFGGDAEMRGGGAGFGAREDGTDFRLPNGETGSMTPRGGSDVAAYRRGYAPPTAAGGAVATQVL